MAVNNVPWDDLLKQKQPWDLNVKQNATVDDTIKLIVDTINQCAHTPYVEQLTKSLLARSTSYHDFLKRLFDFACKNVTYRLDPAGEEIIMTPWRLLMTGYGDCKKLSTLIDSVLKCAGVNPLLKVISYDGTNFEHIYAIVPEQGGGYITLDPVNNCKYNAEIPHKKAMVVDLNNQQMNLHLLGKRPGMSGNVLPSDRFLNYLHGPELLSITPQDRFLNNLNTATATIDGGLSTVSSGTDTQMSKADLDRLIESSVLLTIYSADYNNGNLGLEAAIGPVQTNTADPNQFNISGLGAKDILCTAACDVAHPFNKAKRDACYSKCRDVEKQVAAKVAAIAQPIIDQIKKIGAAPMRGAFLLILDTNAFGLASSLKNAWLKDPGAVKNWWGTWGGDGDSLRKAIVNGSGVQLSGRGMGFAVEAITAALAAASAIIASVIAFLKKLGLIKPKQEQDATKATSNALKGAAKDLNSNNTSSSTQDRERFTLLLTSPTNSPTPPAPKPASESNSLLPLALTAIAAKVLLFS